ncbi:MAG: hypothetical protein EOO20_01625 [Chryseobacterium sp.]|nr:MAG: hypothetical protein EOO20_01625 [Chryseobacterium sp.]
MGWFNYLKEQGFFDPANNPAPVAVDKGYQMPSWEALDYLDKIASTFQTGENLELIPEILKIIKDTSEQPVDNYRTWYRIIRLLSMVPNENVPAEYLDYIPIWVNSNFDTLLQTSEICKTLLPKFLTEKNEDIKKAEKILFHLFELKRLDSNDSLDNYDREHYKSPFYLFHLHEAFQYDDLISIITGRCSNDPLYKLLDSVNILLRDTEVVAQEKSGGFTFDFKISRKFHDLSFLISKNDGEHIVELKNDTINDYFSLEKNWLDKYLNDVFDTLHLDPVILPSVLERLYFGLNNDLNSIFGYNGIKDLDDETSHSNKVLDIFSLILREWLVKLASQNATNAERILMDLMTENSYDLPYFKRMTLYVISTNWQKLRDSFWKLVDDNDSLRLFSTDAYKLELFHLLKAVSADLTSLEETRIWDILEYGPVGERHYTASKESWQHRWLDALKDNSFFEKKYRRLTNKTNLKANYAEEGKVTVRIGHVAPFELDELLAMNDDEIAQRVLSFRNKDRWEDPTIDGFADLLGKAVEDAPQRFSKSMPLFKEASFLYIYEMLYGFVKAWKANKDFDWKTVLEFCLDYISSEAFISGRLKSDDDLRANKDWIYGHIGNLISSGTQDDDHSYSNQLLSVTKKILLKIVPDLEPNVFKDPGRDYIMHLLNSTQGKVLTALVDYSLKKARNLEDSTSGEIWDIDAKKAFESSFDKAIIDGYILSGMYLSQFMYLDANWLKQTISKTPLLEDQYWKPFMGGIGYGKPVSLEYYPLMYPNYKRAVETASVDLNYHQGILRHFLAFYFWDYEDAFEKTLLYSLLKDPTPKLLQELGSLLMQQRKSIKAEPEPRASKLIEKIYSIWRLINYHLAKIDPKELNDLRNLTYLLDYIEVLDDNNVKLVLDNMSLLGNEVSNYHLMNSVAKWTKNSPPPLVAEIANKIKLQNFYEKEPITNLVEFLYENEQLDVANQIVNKLSMEGYDFLKPMYQKYNN